MTGSGRDPILRTIPRAATCRHVDALKLAAGFVYNPAVAASPSPPDGSVQRLEGPMAALRPYILTGVRA
jgi:hypothetical protein